MTTTLGNLIDEIRTNLAGYTFQQDRTTHLVEGVTTTTSSSASPTVLKLGGSQNLGQGIVEIDEELLWVDSFDRVANTGTVAPYGRGYLGTIAAEHDADSMVTISPTFPRSAIKKAINDTIASLGANIFAVKVVTFTYNPSVQTYAFANLNIKDILRVTYETIGSSKTWEDVNSYALDPIANPEAFGFDSTDQVQTITLNQAVQPGRTVKVMYATDPVALSQTAPYTEDYATQTGLPASTKDVVVLGAIYRLLSFLDPARAAQVSPQADETDSKRPYGASLTATKQIYALYQQRLQEEVKAQKKNFPPRLRFNRR